MHPFGPSPWSCDPRVIGRWLELLGLCGVVATLPFHLYAWNVGGQSVSPTEATLLLSAAFIGAGRLLGRPRGAGAHPIIPPPAQVHLAWDRFDGPIIFFLVAALLSLLATEYLRLSFRELRTLIVEPILFWYLCRAVLRSSADSAWLLATLLVVTTAVAAVGLAQLVLGGADQLIHLQREIGIVVAGQNVAK